MRLCFLLLHPIFIILSVTVAKGQIPDLPQPETRDVSTPAAAAVVGPPGGSFSPAPSVPQLIPDDVLPPSGKAASPIKGSAAILPQVDDAFKESPLNAAAEDYRRRIEWRKLRNSVVNDTAVKKALATAEAARTDLQKRKLLRNYYEIYFAKLLALASTPEMKAYLTDRKKDHLNSLPQPHVRPEPTPSVKQQ